MVTTPWACGRQDWMPGEGTSANVTGPLLEALVTGAADAPVRLSALAAATAAAPAAAQVTARRRRCLVMFMHAPLFSGGATAARPVSGRSTQRPAPPVQTFSGDFS